MAAADVRAAVQPLLDQPGAADMDVVVLACTHFPLLAEELAQALPGAAQVDGGAGIARRIATLEEATCASPRYLDRHGTPRSVDDLDGHRMVGFRSSATGAVLPLEFIVGGRVRAIGLPVSVTVSGADAYAAAARAGLGLIQAPRYRFAEDFQRGALVPILPEVPPSPLPVSVIYPRVKHLSPRLRVFLDWLAERFQGE